ncbi:MAG: thiamine pyrophosphate-binding protein [Thaumarchaeota archaeon]|nr:thiamine pyrophosphate-binding protein [Nitrososphaerota archaeon]
MVYRHEFLRILASHVRDELVVLGVGGIHHEWESMRKSDGNFFMSGMGYVAHVALGLAIGLPSRQIISMEGDGSILMNLGVLATIGNLQPKNLNTFVFDNECYEAPGGLPTATAGAIDLAEIAKAAGIGSSYTIRNTEELHKILPELFSSKRPSFVCFKIEPGTLKVTPSPVDGTEAKYKFVRHIETTERISILSRPTLPPGLKKVLPSSG